MRPEPILSKLLGVSIGPRGQPCLGTRTAVGEAMANLLAMLGLEVSALPSTGSPPGPHSGAGDPELSESGQTPPSLGLGFTWMEDCLLFLLKGPF